MPCLAYDLPKELWLMVFEFLDYDDLFQFRLCCRQFNKTVTIDWIWSDRCRKRWLKSDQDDPLALRINGDKTVKRGKDWFYYFRFRNRIDQHTLKVLHSIRECEDEDAYSHNIESLIKLGALAVPKLKKLELDSYNDATPYEVTYLARQVLLTMRHKNLFDFIDSASSTDTDEWVHYSEETVFLPLAAMDLAFNRLLPHRIKIMEQVNFQVKREYNDISEFMILPPTLRIDKLMKYLFEALNSARLLHVRQRARYYLDDFMLLRVYAGESKGHPLVLLSIIQAVSDLYKVETVMCEEFLIVRDPKIRDGETYITISQAGTPRIFTRKNLIASMCRIFPSRQVVLSAVIPKLLQPLKTRDLLLKIFDEWSPYCKKSYWNAVTDKSLNSLLQYMPKSRFPVRVSDYDYFQAYWKIKTSAQRAFRNWGQNHFLKFIDSQYPHDKLIVGARLGGNDDEIYLEELSRGQDLIHKKHIIGTNSANLAGKIVADTRLHMKYVVLTDSVANNGSEYLTLMDPLGEINVLLKSDVQVLEPDDVGSLDIKGFIKLLSLSDLGLFFTKFDQVRGLFVPSDIFVNYLESKSSSIDTDATTQYS
ncbi:LAQU0S01e03510g1_1 [Lachancea quebecensis]|uniref:LAQU0S01e03510g1_1 n=1 Tax=Lachancea quebecensis TaxID=1654605 RepID=A0A0P1KL15_9SACH|nr:LAQU0S01e03510g1_1 [Lachancea quebecensis]